MNRDRVLLEEAYRSIREGFQQSLRGYEQDMHRLIGVMNFLTDEIHRKKLDKTRLNEAFRDIKGYLQYISDRRQMPDFEKDNTLKDKFRRFRDMLYNEQEVKDINTGIVQDLKQAIGFIRI